MNWVYGKSEITTIPEGDWYGFIYSIEYTDGTKYIGMKTFYSFTTLPALKTGIPRPNSTRVGKNRNGKRDYFDIVQKESNWQQYTGSSKDIGNRSVKAKYIIELAHSKRYLTYLEVKHLMINEVLESDTYLNSNILGKFFDNIKD